MAGILIVAEHLRGALSPQTAELVALAAALKPQVGGTVSVAVVADRPDEFVEALNLEGVDEILTVSVPSSHFDAALYAEVAVQLAVRQQPRVLLVGHSVSGMGYAPAAAVRLGGALVTDALGVECGARGLTVTRGGYGAKVLTHLEVATAPMVTVMVRAGAVKPADAATGVTVRAVELDLSAVASVAAVHQDYQDPPQSDVDITKAEFILSIGRGIQDEKNIDRFRALADRLGMTLGCSRPLADSGWLPKAHQVGLSGKVAQNCKLYVALGISGAVQHLHGMKHVETIIAVNTDRNAPIYNVATYGVGMDVFEFSDALEKCFN